MCDLLAVLISAHFLYSLQSAIFTTGEVCLKLNWDVVYEQPVKNQHEIGLGDLQLYLSNLSLMFSIVYG